MHARRNIPRWVAVVALVGATLFWGTSFITVKRCGAILADGAGPGTSGAFGPLFLTALRFTVGVPILWAVWPAARAWRPKRADLRPLLKVGLAMSAGFLTQAAGMPWTTATLSAFLTSMTVCLTPLAEWVFHRRGLSGRLGLAVGLAVVGVGLMTLTQGGGYSFDWGEVLTLACAAAFALQILWTNEAADRVGPAGLTVGSFLMVAAVSWLGVAVVWPGAVGGALRAALRAPEFLPMFAVIVVCATILAMILMNAFQRYVRPAEAAVIYTTEPLFASVFAMSLSPSEEALGGWGLVGAAVILLADLLAGVKFGEKHPAVADGPEAGWR